VSGACVGALGTGNSQGRGDDNSGKEFAGHCCKALKSDLGREGRRSCFVFVRKKKNDQRPAFFELEKKQQNNGFGPIRAMAPLVFRWCW
jgi:hypothetical protein